MIRKFIITYIILAVVLLYNTMKAHENDKLVQSSIIGTISSLILPAPASAVASLLPFLNNNDKVRVPNEEIYQANVVKNTTENSSLKYTNSINYINSLD